MSYQTNHYQPSGVLTISRQVITASINIVFLTVLPLVSAAVEYHFTKTGMSAVLVGKWFIFWTVGIRFLVAGFTQVIRQGRGALILQGDTTGGFGKVLGLVKMLLAGMAFLCVMKDSWSLLAAITVGVYVGLAGFQHDFKKPNTAEGWISMVYDMIVFTVITTCLVF